MDKRIAFIDVWFPDRNFGFVHEVRNDGQNYKLFLHGSNILTGSPRSGLVVRFNEGLNSRGPLAIDVEILEPAAGLAALAEASK
jgi:hypothetical protein